MTEQSRTVPSLDRLTMLCCCLIRKLWQVQNSTAVYLRQFQDRRDEDKKRGQWDVSSWHQFLDTIILRPKPGNSTNFCQHLQYFTRRQHLISSNFGYWSLGCCGWMFNFVSGVLGPFLSVSQRQAAGLGPSHLKRKCQLSTIQQTSQAYFI